MGSVARDEKVVIRITAEVKEEMEKICASRGLTLSALGAYAIGTYVEQERKKNELTQKSLDVMLPSMQTLLEGYAVEELNREKNSF